VSGLLRDYFLKYPCTGRLSLAGVSVSFNLASSYEWIEHAQLRPGAGPETLSRQCGLKASQRALGWPPSGSVAVPWPQESESQRVGPDTGVLCM
jgi:hypothetical protein